MLTGDDMMETGLLNWLCPLSLFALPLTLPLPSFSFSLLPRLFVPSLSAFYVLRPPTTTISFFPLLPSLLIAWMCRAQDVRLFPSRHCAVWQRTGAVYHWMTLPLYPHPTSPSPQTTSNIAGPFWSLKRLVLGEEPVLKQKQTKCFICHVCQWTICAA